MQNSLVQTVLVALPPGAGLVRVEDGSVLITDDVAGSRSGAYLGDEDPCHPVKHWVDEDHCLVGGILPPGTASVDVVDDRGVRVLARIGGGAYVALLDQPTDGHEPIVCCRDAAGDPIRRPWPNDYPSVPVSDAEDPCPACGALDYEEYKPFEEWRGGRGGPDGVIVPNPVVSCRVCGHDEPEPTFMRSSSDPGDHQDVTQHAAGMAKVRAQILRQQWLSTQETLFDTRFPIYAADGWPSQLAGSGSQDGRSTEITIRHHDTPVTDPLSADRPRVEITTTQGDSLFSELRQVRHALDSWLRADSAGTHWPDGSGAALTLWLRARDRDRRAAVLGAKRTEQPITIDGTRTPSLMLRAGGRWVAIARHATLTITITIAGHEVDPASLRLQPITDPVAQLLGPEPLDS